MLLPDVTAIINDPDVGGGIPFRVRRVTNRRVIGGVTQTEELIDLTGNIQPQGTDTRPSTAEDILSEGIVVRALFRFSAGENAGGAEFRGPDEILYDGFRWRVTRVEDWYKWGYTAAYAEKVLDAEAQNGMDG